MNQDQISKLLNFYRQYNRDITPLVYEIELLCGKFPVNILNEIRSFTHHIGKASKEGAPEAEINSQLSKADGHLLRAHLDCYKTLCIYYNDEYKDKFPVAHKKYDLSVVNNGEFLPAMSQMLQQAISNTSLAKNAETVNSASALPLFEVAAATYRNLHLYVMSSSGGIYTARMRFRKKNIILVAITFVATTILGAVLDRPINQAVDAAYDNYNTTDTTTTVFTPTSTRDSVTLDSSGMKLK